MATKKDTAKTTEEVKVTATKVATEEVKVEPEVKAEVAEKEEAVKTTAKKTTAKKTTTKKTTTKKATAEKAPAEKKTTTRAKKLAPKVVIQYQHIEVEETELIDRFKGLWSEMGRKDSEIKDLVVYVKPEEYCAYFVVNNIDTVRVYL